MAQVVSVAAWMTACSVAPSAELAHDAGVPAFTCELAVYDETAPLGAAGTFYRAWAQARASASARCFVDAWHRGSTPAIGLPGSPAQIDALVAGGGLAFDAAEATACLDALAALACTPDDLFALESRIAGVASCRRALHGTRHGDSLCTNPFECETGCNTSYGCPGFCNGHDAGPPDAGLDAWVDQCGGSSWPAACGEGSGVCLGMTSDVAGCVHVAFTAALDESCAGPDGTLCAPGLVCGHDAFFTDTWHCEMPYPSHDRCHFAIPEGCPVGEICDGTRCQTAPTDGAPCLHSDELRVDHSCATGHVCDDTDTCRALVLTDPPSAITYCCTPVFPDPPDAGFVSTGIDS